MRIGLVVGMNEVPSGIAGWKEVEAQVQAAEAVGFDIAVFADAFTFGGAGFWESMTFVGAAAATTTTIELSHSVIGAPLRSPAVIARSAEAIDEISGGRYTLGIGAGNTPEDFAAYSIPVDRKFSRFEEALTIIHSLLREGSVDFEGEFYTASRESFSPRGPRPNNLPIVVAAKGPRALGMAARFADGWNWWGSASQPADGLADITAALAKACEVAGRDPASLLGTYDLYSFDPLGVSQGGEWVLGGSSEQMAESILSIAEFGIGEVRCDLVAAPGQRVAATEAMAEVVELVHAG